MSYLPNIPQASDKQRASQPQILANFGQLDTSMDVDHYKFSDISGNTGKHKKVTIPEQSSAPNPGVNEGALYTKETNSRTTLFYQQENSGDEIQMTGPTPVTGITNASLQDGGYTFLPGGLLLQWGKTTNSVWNGNTVTFPVAFGAAPYCITCNQQYLDGVLRSFVQITSISSATTFTPRLVGTNGGDDTSASTLYFQAIGPIA